MPRPCCSPYHDEGDCYHCFDQGTCLCTDEEIKAKAEADAQFYADNMKCWCGACEDEEGRPLNPAPCAQFERNQEWARADAEVG